MRGRWKSLFSDSFVQLAVILSLLRTDLRVYLRQYSSYPEVQQALLGESVGLRLVDNYHNNDLLPLPSTKYVDDSHTDYIFNEINRLIQTPVISPRHQTHIISAWLLNNDTAHASTSTEPSAASGISAELSRQDVELIESLWKEDLDINLGVRGAFSLSNKEQNEDSIVDEDTGIQIHVPESFPLHVEELNNSPEAALRSPSQTNPTYNTQTSLELALQDLNTYEEGDEEMIVQNDETITNSSALPPFDQLETETDQFVGATSTNSSGVLWGATQSTEHLYSRQNSFMNASMGVEPMSLPEPSLLEDLGLPDDIDIDFNLDILEPNIRDSLSEDSAVSVGSSPTHSWSDQASTSGNERYSMSSDLFDPEEGAVGYSDCKTEPYDNGFFDDYLPRPPSKYEKNAVSHDHTYGAPPGGIPHVRKMDIKTPKVPSRGYAHDEMMCKKMKIPFSVDTIINSPVDEFNSLMEKYRLNPKQTSLIKDIRRRGKNKVAAQNCRQKKVGEYTELEGEVHELKSEKNTLQQRKNVLLKKSSEVRKHIDIMSAEIFRTLRDENGMPYDTSRFQLEVGGDGEIQVVSTENRRSRNSRKKLDKKKRRR